MLIVDPSVGAIDPQAHWLLSWKALKGPFSKLNGIGHAIRSEPHEFAIQRYLQFIILLKIAKRIASL
jgi:hypothetical protein